LTIADPERLRSSREDVQQVAESLLAALIDGKELLKRLGQVRRRSPYSGDTTRSTHRLPARFMELFDGSAAWPCAFHAAKSVRIKVAALKIVLTPFSRLVFIGLRKFGVEQDRRRRRRPRGDGNASVGVNSPRRKLARFAFQCPNVDFHHSPKPNARLGDVFFGQNGIESRHDGRWPKAMQGFPLENR
jgi:hypothetical protein